MSTSILDRIGPKSFEKKFKTKIYFLIFSLIFFPSNYFAGLRSSLLWHDEWISFLDTMLQMCVLSAQGRSLRLPTRIKSLRIDPGAHGQYLQEVNDQKGRFVKVGSRSTRRWCVQCQIIYSIRNSIQKRIHKTYSHISKCVNRTSLYHF